MEKVLQAERSTTENEKEQSIIRELQSFDMVQGGFGRSMSNEVEDQGRDQLMVGLHPSLEIVDSLGSWRD